MSCLCGFCVSRQSFDLSSFTAEWFSIIVMYNILFCVSIHSRRVFGLFPIWSNYGQSCYKHLFMHLFVNVGFCFTGSMISESTWKCMIHFIKTKPLFFFSKVILDLCQFFVAMHLYLIRGKIYFSASFQSLNFWSHSFDLSD